MNPVILTNVMLHVKIAHALLQVHNHWFCDNNYCSWSTVRVKTTCAWKLKEFAS